MPSLSRLFHSRSSLKSNFKTREFGEQRECEIESSKISQSELIDIRAQMNAAKGVLIQLDILVTALQDNVEEPSAASSHPGYPQSSAGASLTTGLRDMKRSTESLARTIRRHAPLPPPPNDTPICAQSASASNSSSALYPAPLRLPHDDRSPFDQETNLLDSQLSQRHSLNSVMPCTDVSVRRPASLPVSTFDVKIAHATHSPPFSTRAKTQKLRSMQQDVTILDEDRPLSIDELLKFLRKGNSMREI